MQATILVKILVCSNTQKCRSNRNKKEKIKRYHNKGLKIIKIELKKKDFELKFWIWIDFEFWIELKKKD